MMNSANVIKGPQIRTAGNITLTPEIENVLQRMFSAFSEVFIEIEFGRGFSGSRAFRVRLIEGSGQAQLPAVVKIAPAGVIRAEWQAYQRWVDQKLPNSARLEKRPVFLEDGSWGGLRYALVGSGIFNVQSLGDYYHLVTIEDLDWVLENRLFRILGKSWWWDNRAHHTFQMQADYDRLLPVNLLIEPVDQPPARIACVIEADQPLPSAPIAKGDAVRIRGFVVTEVDRKQGQLTLNLPSAPDGQPAVSHRLRLDNVPNIERYQAGDTIASLDGLVLTTRRDRLTDEVQEAWGDLFDLTGERLSLPTDFGGPSTNRSHLSPPPSSLPNPLEIYESLLQKVLTVNVSTIHGDLNLENILVDPQTREVSLIDFATVRQGHVLHDLLRLETEAVITLLPPLLREAALPPETIFYFYEAVHQATFDFGRFTSAAPPLSILEKPFKFVGLIRKTAGRCLFDADEWREYYQGMILYLLGALKIKVLRSLPTAPLPKQVAFLGAASLAYFLETPPPRREQASKKTPLYAPPPVEEHAPAIEPPFGAMPPTSRLYIERAADEQCRTRINQNYAATLFIKAPRQMGKTSLIHRTLYLAGQEHHKQSAFVDFQEFPKQYFDDGENFLIQFCLSIGSDLGIPSAIDKYWQGAQSSSLKCKAYMAEYIIPQVNTPFVLALDELDRVLVSPFRDNFFGMLRAWHNLRARSANFARLSLLLSSSTEPYLFIDNPNQSPFNVAEVITLQDFTRAEVDDLNQRHPAPLDRKQVDELMALVAGHPFLTRLALYQTAAGQIPWETLLAQATADNGPFGDHLRHYLDLMRQKPDLKQALADICRRQTCADDQMFHRLKGAGLVKRDGRRVVLRNKLYTRYFKERLDV